MSPNYLGALEKGRNMPSVDTLLEMGDVYGVTASDIVREVEEARRAARRDHAAAGIANTPAVK
jgi:transcriptional regulator with XRE-family HTH domain